MYLINIVDEVTTGYLKTLFICQSLRAVCRRWCPVPIHSDSKMLRVVASCLGSCVVYEPLGRDVDRHLDRYVGRHIGRASTDMSVDMSADSRPMCRLRCVGRHVDRHIGRSVDRYVGRYVDRYISIAISAECRSTCRSIGYRHSADTSLLLAYWWL